MSVWVLTLALMSSVRTHQARMSVYPACLVTRLVLAPAMVSAALTCNQIHPYFTFNLIFCWVFCCTDLSLSQNFPNSHSWCVNNKDYKWFSSSLVLIQQSFKTRDWRAVEPSSRTKTQLLIVANISLHHCWLLSPDLFSVLHQTLMSVRNLESVLTGAVKTSLVLTVACATRAFSQIQTAKAAVVRNNDAICTSV